jgi:hypothetical protein
MSRKPPHFPKTKTVGGRAKGEGIPGAAALVNHKNRHQTPGILAQTAPKKQPGAGRVKRALVSSAMGTPNNVLALEELSKDERWTQDVRAMRALPAEPAAAIVNTTPARENQVQDVIRVGLATTAVLITTPEAAAKIGRILAMRFSFEDERVRVIATISDKGYQFGKYPTNSDGLEQMRTSHDRKLAVIGDNVPDFGLCPAAEWECDGTTLIITMPRHLPIVRKYSSKKGMSRSSPEAPLGDRKPPSRLGAVPVEQALEELPVKPVTLEEMLAEPSGLLEDADPVRLDDKFHLLGARTADGEAVVFTLPTPPQVPSVVESDFLGRKRVGEIMERDDMDVGLKVLRDAVRTINAAKDERGDELRLYLDTTTGKLTAKVEVTL